MVLVKKPSGALEQGRYIGTSSKVIEIFGDCDDDTLLITVEQTGAACHTGNHSCFYTQLK